MLDRYLRALGMDVHIYAIYLGISMDGFDFCSFPLALTLTMKPSKISILLCHGI